MTKHLLSLLFIFVSLLNCESNTSQTDSDVGISTSSTNLFIGTYTRDEGWVNGKADGIYSTVIEENGTLNVTNTTEVINPSFVSISNDKKNLYAVSELGRNGETGAVYAFNINEDQSLTLIDQYSTNSKSPAHVNLDSQDRLVFVSNYQGGVAVVYARNEDGSLEFLQQLDHSGSGPHPRQESSHVHQTMISPNDSYLYLPDLGTDKIWSYKIDYNSGSLVKTDQEFASVAPGSGPRHMRFHPNGKFAYVMNELNSTVSVMTYNDETGALNQIQAISTLPETYSDFNTTADIHIHPNGEFLYGSNRGHNSIVSYSINQTTGELSLVTHTSTEGDFPRNFGIEPTGLLMYVANQNSDNITIFDIDPATGSITFTGNELSVPTPVCIAFY